MKLVILYRPNSEHSSTVESFMRDFESRYHPDAKIEVMDLNTRDGAAMASIYDIVQYPAMMAMTDEGRPINTWQGDILPLMDEVAGALV